MQSEEQLEAVPGRRDGQGSYDRNLPITVSPMSEKGRLAARRPSPPPQRHHQEPDFVNENESRRYASGVFLPGDNRP